MWSSRTTDLNYHRPNKKSEVMMFFIFVIASAVIAEVYPAPNTDFGTFALFSVLVAFYGAFSLTIFRGYYKKEDLKEIKEYGINSRIKIEEIELIALYSAFLYSVYILTRSIPELISPDASTYWKMSLVGCAIIILAKWIDQNQHNMKVLGDLRDRT